MLIPRILQRIIPILVNSIFLLLYSLFSFIFANWFLDSEIFAFMLVVIFAAFDFWTVKNVTGRILVGLRWWSEVDDSGTE